MPSPASSSPHSRRQWLISRGLLSPHGPSRRLTQLLPSRRSRSADIDVTLESDPTPVLVARCSQERGSAPRARSMPTERMEGVAGGAWKWFGRRKKMQNGGAGGKCRVKVVDRGLPRGVLDGNGTDVGTKEEWKRYEEKMEKLKNDERYLEYLTEGIEEEEKGAEVIGEGLAVNKLYPLAFIRLLEAQMRGREREEREKEEEGEDELHRYDDVEEEEEDGGKRLKYVAGLDRFRTVGSVYRSEKDGQSNGVGLIERREGGRDGRNTGRVWSTGFRVRAAVLPGVKTRRTASVSVF